MQEHYIQAMRKKIGTDMLLIPTVDCLILNKDDNILLQLRSDTHIWGIPGGMIELSETVQEALTREVREETGLLIQKPQLFGIYSGEQFQYTYPNGDNISPVKIVFVVHIYSGTLTKDAESDDLQFFNIRKLPEDIHSSHMRIIEDYIRLGKKGLTIPQVK